MKFNGIEITFVQVFPLKEQVGKLRGYARIVFNDCFQLTGLRVLEGSNGLFVGYPNDPNHKGEDYSSLFYPVTKDLRDEIEKLILDKFYELQR